MKTIYTLVFTSFLLAQDSGLAQTNRVIYSSGAALGVSAAAARSTLAGVSSNAPQVVTIIRLQGQTLPPNTMSRAGTRLARPVGPLELDPPPCATPPGLVAWWPGNDDCSDVFGNDQGTPQNGASFRASVVAHAFSFNGVDQAVEIPYSTNLTTPKFSVEAWVYPDSQVDDPINQDLIFGQSYGRCQLLVRPGNTNLTVAFSFAANPSTWYEVVSTDGIPIQDWTHLVGTWDGTTLSIYTNGQLCAYASPGPGIVPWDSGCPFHIGGLYDPEGDCAYVGQFFNGAIDEVSYYVGALSADDVQALYAANSNGKCLAQPPYILSQPASQRVSVGANVTFSVTAGGMGPLSYQWYLESNPVTGATDSTLTLTGVQQSDSGNYWVAVSNPYGLTPSDIAILTVYVPTCFLPPDGLVGWWAGEGNAYDSLCANIGILQGGVTFTNGMVGQAFNFDSTSHQYLDVPDSPVLNPTAAVSVEAWVYPRPPLDSVAAPVIKKAGGGGDSGQEGGFSLELSGPDAIMFWVCLDGGQSWTPSPSVALPPNQWSHVAGVYDGSSVYFYINGVSVGTPTAASGAIMPSGNSLQVGHDPSCPERYFNGLIDEPSIYTNALSGAQIQAIYEAGVAGKCRVTPNITVQPTSQGANQGANATFTVVATSTTPLSYQWHFNGVDITGATGTMYNVTGAQAGNAGTYSVTVQNCVGTTTSTDAVLTVIPAAWLVQYFGENYLNNTNAAINADPDGDGWTNLQEYKYSTNPTAVDPPLIVFTPLK